RDGGAGRHGDRRRGGDRRAAEGAGGGPARQGAGARQEGRRDDARAVGQESQGSHRRSRKDARDLGKWGAPKWPPKPPNVRSAPAQPGRSSRRRQPMGAPKWPPKPPTFGAPRHSRGAPLDGAAHGGPEMAPYPQPSERPGAAERLLAALSRDEAAREVAV